MKKHRFPLALLVLFVTLGLSCGNEGTEQSQEADLATSNVDTSLVALTNFISQLKQQSILKKEDEQKQLVKIEQLLTELAQLEGGFQRIRSGPIEYDNGNPEQDFLPRRKEFFKQFKVLVDYNIFPHYFQIDRASIEQLYAFGQRPEYKNLQVVRMYPVYDYRIANKYSYAFAWADTASSSLQMHPGLIIDIIDPCPPPFGNCKD